MLPAYVKKPFEKSTRTANSQTESESVAWLLHQIYSDYLLKIPQPAMQENIIRIDAKTKTAEIQHLGYRGLFASLLRRWTGIVSALFPIFVVSRQGDCHEKR